MPAEIGFPTLTNEAFVNQKPNKQTMNNRRLLIGGVFHYIQWKKTVKNITSWHKTLPASPAKVNKFQDAT